MNQLLTPPENQLLALVRASLWQKPVEEEAFMCGSVDWNMIGRLAMEQTVGGLVFEAALSLPENLLPPKEWRLKAIAFLETNRRTHLHVNKCTAESVRRLRDAGIYSTLLKGQAYASVYPKPGLRQCGDINLYVGDEDFQSAYSVANGFGWECKDEFKAEDKHYGCGLHGVKIELHRVVAKILPRSADCKFRLWSHDQISSSECTISIEKEMIPIPTPLFDVVFVFLHLYYHFLNGGIGLRHICDWAMLLHAHRGKIDSDELARLLKSLQLLKAWRLFTPIPVLSLGLPEGECPFSSNKNVEQATGVLSAIFQEGNFGRAKTPVNKRPMGYFAGKMYSVKVMSGKYLTKFRFDPKRIMCHFYYFIVRGIAQVVKDIRKGDTR